MRRSAPVGAPAFSQTLTGISKRNGIPLRVFRSAVIALEKFIVCRQKRERRPGLPTGRLSSGSSPAGYLLRGGS